MEKLVLAGEKIVLEHASTIHPIFKRGIFENFFCAYGNPNSSKARGRERYTFAPAFLRKSSIAPAQKFLSQAEAQMLRANFRQARSTAGGKIIIIF